MSVWDDALYRPNFRTGEKAYVGINILIQLLNYLNNPLHKLLLLIYSEILLQAYSMFET